MLGRIAMIFKADRICVAAIALANLINGANSIRSAASLTKRKPQ